MKLSVIVPVYNRINTLPRCVDSIIGQDLENYEVILVDDGSTDGSTDIIRAYVAEHPERVRAFYQKNGGVASARNAGLAAASGEYVTYVDSDDWVVENCFGRLWRLVCEKRADILVFDAMEYFSDRTMGPFPAFMDRMADTEQGELKTSQYLLARPCPWNKWIRRSLFTESGFRFPEGRQYEDLGTIPLLALAAEHIYYVKDVCYCYDQSGASIMRTEEYRPGLDDIFVVAQILKKALAARFPAETEFLWWEHLLLSAGKRYLDCDRKELAVRVSDAMRAAYPDWRRNVYVEQEPAAKRMLAGLIYQKAFGRAKLLRSVKQRLKRIVCLKK